MAQRRPDTGRATRRRLGFGALTGFGLRRRGFFIPYRHADALAVPPPGEVAYPALVDRFIAAEPAFLAHLRAIDDLALDLMAIGDRPPPAPRWQQDWFPRLDAAAAYAMVRQHRPATLLEVGAGHSTRWFARAIADTGLATRLIAIDPAPRANLDGLAVQVIRATVQTAGTEPFDGLAAGDMVSIDSSHILMPGTDVDMLINGILPSLQEGVLIHIHDILLPDGYPSAWDWRGYNEQLGIAALLHGGGYRLLWSSHWLATRLAGAVSASVIGRLPLPDGAIEASLWLAKGG